MSGEIDGGCGCSVACTGNGTLDADVSAAAEGNVDGAAVDSDGAAVAEGAGNEGSIVLIGLPCAFATLAVGSAVICADDGGTVSASSMT